jgi:hypothetical protein
MIGFVIGDAFHSFNDHPRLSAITMASLLVQLILILRLSKPAKDSNSESEV